MSAPPLVPARGALQALSEHPALSYQTVEDWLTSVGTNWAVSDADYCAQCESPNDGPVGVLDRCPECGCSFRINSTRAMSNWVLLIVRSRQRAAVVDRPTPAESSA